MINKICKICNKNYKTKNKLTSSFCSIKCKAESQIGKPSFNKGKKGLQGVNKTSFKKGQKKLKGAYSFKKGHQINKGRPSFRKGKEYPEIKGEKNYSWKGGEEERIKRLPNCLNCNKKLKHIESKFCLNCRFLGERNSSYKGGITPQIVKIRSSIEYDIWRNGVIVRDNYTCQKYGTRGSNLVAHHIQNFSQFPELRFAIDNGITLSEKAHKEFHKKYGKQNNTKEQLLEFLNISSNE